MAVSFSSNLVFMRGDVGSSGSGSGLRGVCVCVYVYGLHPARWRKCSQRRLFWRQGVDRGFLT